MLATVTEFATLTLPELKLTVGVEIVSLDVNERVTVSPTLATDEDKRLLEDKEIEERVGAVVSKVVNVHVVVSKIPSKGFPVPSETSLNAPAVI